MITDNIIWCKIVLIMYLEESIISQECNYHLATEQHCYAPQYVQFVFTKFNWLLYRISYTQPSHSLPVTFCYMVLNFNSALHGPSMLFMYLNRLMNSCILSLNYKNQQCCCQWNYNTNKPHVGWLIILLIPAATCRPATIIQFFNLHDIRIKFLVMPSQYPDFRTWFIQDNHYRLSYGAVLMRQLCLIKVLKSKSTHSAQSVWNVNSLEYQYWTGCINTCETLSEHSNLFWS